MSDGNPFTIWNNMQTGTSESSNFLFSIFKHKDGIPLSFFQIPLPIYVFMGITTVCLAVATINESSENALLPSLPLFSSSETKGNENAVKESQKVEEEKEEEDEEEEEEKSEHEEEEEENEQKEESIEERGEEEEPKEEEPGEKVKVGGRKKSKKTKPSATAKASPKSKPKAKKTKKRRVRAKKALEKR